MSNRYIFLVLFSFGLVFSQCIIATDVNSLDALLGGNTSSNNQLTDALFGASSSQPTATNIQATAATTPVVTSSNGILPVVSNSAQSSNQPETADDITNQINNALNQNQSSIAQGLEQRVNGSGYVTDAQKQNEEQLLIGEFSEDPALVKYLQNYVKMFGDAQYAKVGQAFTTNLQAIQAASFSQLASTDFLKKTIQTSEKNLADLYTAYTNYGLHPDITLDNVFTRSFFDVVNLYGMYLKTLSSYLGQMVITDKIVVTDIVNLQQCATLIIKSFDTLKGLYFQNQQQLLQDSGMQTVAAETLFAEQVLLVAAISARHRVSDTSLNYYADCPLALAWAEIVLLFAGLPNATYPHTASMNLYIAGYQTFEDYIEEVCGNLAKILDYGVRNGSRQMTGSASNNKTVLDTLSTYYNTVLQLYALQNTDAAKMASSSLQKYFTSIDKVYSDAFKTETDVTASVNKARQVLLSPGKNLAQIKSAVVEFATAQKSYAALISTFNSINDTTDSAYSNQLLQQMAGDNYIGLACFYWQSFLQDAQAGGALLATLPIKVTNSTLESTIASLNSMCLNAVAVLSGNKNPYAFSANDTTTSIMQMYKNASDAYNSASTQVSTAGTASASSTGLVDSIMDLSLISELENSVLQTMQTYFENFGKALQALKTVSSDNFQQFQISVTNALSAAAILQNIAQQDKQFAEFLTPIGGDWNKALLSTLAAIFSEQSFGSEQLLQYMYGTTLQASLQYTLPAQQAALTSLLTKLGSQVDISHQVQQSLQAAQAATNAATALPLWNTAINLAQTYYTLGKSQLSLQDSATRLQNYITTVQAYVNFAVFKTPDFATALILYRVAAQAYCATQSCIQANISLPATITAAAVGQLVIQAAHNSANTGVLDFIMKDVQNLTAKTDPAQQLQAQTQLQNDMQQLNVYIQNQNNDWAPFALQTGIVFTPLLAGSVNTQDSYVYTVTTKEGATTNCVIPNYNTAVQPAELLQAKTVFASGQAATILGDFVTGTKSYSQAAQLFYNASASMKDSDAITNAQNQYYLSQTRMQASGVAALIQPCSLQTIGNFKNVPTAYIVSSAQITLDPSVVGALPVSLTKTQTTPLSATQIVDFVQVLQVYIVYSHLQNQGYDPAKYYKAASLQHISGLSDSQIDMISEYEQIAQNYSQQIQAAFATGLQSGSQLLKFSATLQAQPAGPVVIACTNLPIPLLIPVTPQGYTAGAYYIGAYQLFQPGTALLNFGSQVYVPGQDAVTSGLLLEYIMQLYLGCAYNYGQIATNIYNQFSSKLSSIEDITTLNDAINQMNLAYQNGIAYIQSNSNSQNTAYGYAVSLATLNASYASYPNNVNQYVISLYDQWAVQLQSCLVGNPTSSGYQNVLSSLNAVYMQQSNVMQSLTPQSNQKIAAAFKKAGDACMRFAMEDPINGRVSVYPYDTASGYYSAALSEYTKMIDTANQNAMNQQLNLVGVSQIEQYAKLYYDVKTNGTTYLNAQGKPQTITWNQLGIDYLNYANSGTNLGASQVIDPGELAEYNRVKNLLLNASINCSYVQNALSSNTGIPSTASASSSSAKTDSTNLQQVITSLISFNSDFANLGTTGLDLTSESIRTSLLQHAVGEYNLFASTSLSLLSTCMSQISSALSYQYIYDYLGGLPASTASNFSTALQTEWTQFFTALQNEAQSLENPASSYLG